MIINLLLGARMSNVIQGAIVDPQTLPSDRIRNASARRHGLSAVINNCHNRHADRRIHCHALTRNR